MKKHLKTYKKFKKYSYDFTILHGTLLLFLEFSYFSKTFPTLFLL